MKTLKITAVLLVAATSLSMVAKPVTKLCSGYLPENDMNIPVESYTRFGSQQKAGGVSEKDFNAVIDRIERLYRDEVKNRYGNLVINRYWEDGKVNAYAEREGDNVIVNMFGGLARHEKMTPDAFAMVVCHELGHHMGGFPKMKVIKTWGTAEGASDYFAATKCMRKYIAEDLNNYQQLEGVKLDKIAVDACRNQFDNDTDRLICARNMLAGQSLAYVLKSMNMGFTLPKFSTPDRWKSLWTKMLHPNAQCRLDTYFNGALCLVDKDIPLDDKDYHVGSCTKLTHKNGFRPACWFKADE